MKFPLYNQQAKNVGTVELADAVFAAPMNRDLLYQVVTSQLSNTRQVIAHAKGRSEVRGGGKKPWRQKGTGRARHGSIRSPIWKGGGVTFGPTKERNFKKKINRKMAHKALAVALSAKVKDKELVVIENLALEQWKTKIMAQALRGMNELLGGRASSVLIVTPKNMSDTVVRVARNLPGVDVLEAKNMNALQVMSRKYVVMFKEAAENMAPAK